MAELPVDYASLPQSSMNSGSSSPLIGHDQLELDTNTSLASASHISHIPPREIFSLTDIGNGGPAATEVAEYLVQAVGRDVVSFRRNTQVSYLAVERARDIVKAINEYIAKVEESTTGDWDSFEKFTMAIEPLEDILLTLLAFTEDEKARYFANIDSINDCVSSTESWAHNRKELSKALGGFDTRQELKELFNEPNTELRQREHEEAQSYDDITLLEEMRTTLKAFIYEDLNRFPPYVRHVETSLDALQTAVIDGSTPEWLTVITIQTSMLVEGIVEMVKVVTLDTDTLNHLKSKPVWTAASELIEVLSLNKAQSDLPHSAKEKYDAFVQALLTMGELTLPESYVELMKQVGRIRRPFQAQAVALVMLCRFLADNFKAIGKSAVSVENVNSLDAAFDQTLATLQAATKAVSDLRAFDLTNFTSHATVQAFVGAEALIQESFKSFNLNAEWAQRRSELSAAVNKDMKRMEKLNDVLSRSPSSTTAKVRVNVTIHDKSINGMKLGATSVEGEMTMRLLALRWSASGELEQEEIKRAARTAGTFFKRTQDGWSKIAASHSTLAEIVDGESEVTLKLVVA